MTRFAAIAAGWLLAVVLAAGPSGADAFPTTSPTQPTPAQRQEMEATKERADRARRGYDEAKEREARARERAREFALQGNTEMARRWRELAQRWRELAERWSDLEKRIREWLVERVDLHFNLEAPPGTTYEYDPNSRSAAHVPRQGTSKDAKRVVFCPNSFEFCINVLASVKLHELRHAWQVHNCWSDQPGFWGDCTFWGHLAEWDAYAQQELAHDNGTIPLPDWVKDIIRERLRNHRRSALDQLGIGSFFRIDRMVVLPGSMREFPVTVVNTTDQERDLAVSLVDDLGWNIFPPDLVELTLGPGESHSLEYAVEVPPDAQAGVNRLQLFDLPSSESPLPSDTLWVSVVPHATIHEPDMMFIGGKVFPEVTIEFLISSPRPSTDPVHLTLEMSNTEGWPMSDPIIDVTVSEDEPALIQTTVLIESEEMPFDKDDPPDFVPSAAGVVTITAIPGGDFDAAFTAQIPVRVQQLDIAPIGFEFQTPFLPVAGTPTPMSVLVMNVGELDGDSPFDVTYQVHGPGEDGPVVYDERVTMEKIDAGEVISVDFPSLTFDEPGIYTATIVAPAPLPDKQDSGVPDVDPENDEIVQTFEVLESPTIIDQWGIF